MSESLAIQRPEDDFGVGQSAILACVLEASVPKIGNVPRGADFEDCTFYDFLTSAVAIGQVFDRAHKRSVGELIFESARTTQRWVGTNTNLGILLLLAPLAKLPDESSLLQNSNQEKLRGEIQKVLDSLTLDDRDLVLEAIRLARPGGLGKVPDGDVNQDRSNMNQNLVELMQLASERDTIALQYTNGFEEVLSIAWPAVENAFQLPVSLADGLVHAQLKIMSRITDSLIARKCGPSLAESCRVRARQIVEQMEPGSSEYLDAVSDFDFWLRSDGHRRNPGTTADLMAAAIFLGLRLGVLDKCSIQQALERTRRHSNPSASLE